MNEKLFKKLYTEITRDSNDPMDGGRAELALELITENSSFLEENYPNYYGCNNIACIDDLSKVVFKSDEAGSHARMLLIELGYDRCLDWLAKEEAKAHELATNRQLRRAIIWEANGGSES